MEEGERGGPGQASLFNQVRQRHTLHLLIDAHGHLISSCTGMLENSTLYLGLHCSDITSSLWTKGRMDFGWQNASFGET
jgi:hypothetical protein